MYRIYDNHSNRLPFVRIKRVELTNFKAVEHGVIDFNCAKEFIPFNTKSDILGLYGQNGSGKSSFIEALDLIKGIIAGYKIGAGYAQLIDVSAKEAYIRVDFDFQYRSGEIITVIYEVKLEAIEVPVEEKESKQGTKDSTELRLCISDEKVKTTIYSDGTVGRIHPIVDTTGDQLFCSRSLEENYFNGKDKDVRNELTYLKRKLYEDSNSFVFSHVVSEILNQKNDEEHSSRYYEILAELALFVEHFLYVIDTRGAGFVQLKAGIPIYLPHLIENGNRPIILNEKTVIEKELYEHVEQSFRGINTVLETLIPGMQLKLSTSPTSTKEGEEGLYITILSTHGDKTIPLSYESDGIVRIISLLADFIYAFNQGSATLVVDEFDSGVFEFLLGELLKVFEASGKGQLIFTSHNLRPLEVLDKKFIRFTTADPKNRYYKIKNIGNSNNLRNIYLREAVLGNQEMEMYRRTKSFKMAKALRVVGEESSPDDK